jgi:hypothetical protein
MKAIANIILVVTFLICAPAFLIFLFILLASGHLVLLFLVALLVLLAVRWALRARLP